MGWRIQEPNLAGMHVIDRANDRHFLVFNGVLQIRNTLQTLNRKFDVLDDAGFDSLFVSELIYRLQRTRCLV